MFQSTSVFFHFVKERERLNKKFNWIVKQQKTAQENNIHTIRYFCTSTEINPNSNRDPMLNMEGATINKEFRFSFSPFEERPVNPITEVRIEHS